MALTGKKAQRNGWRHQAEHLALNHTAVTTTMLASAEQARRRRAFRDAECERGLETSKTDHPHELMPPSMKYAELEQQVARESAIARTLNSGRETLAARAARVGAADKRIAELESELGMAREALVLRENENHSLQTSFDLIASDNLSLSSRLTERDAAVDEAHSQLKQIKTTLAAVEVERNKLVAAVAETNEKRQTETNTLNTRLEAMSARAITAEKLLAEARQSLLACSEEKSSAERKLTDATAARHAADKNLELLQNSLRVKERQVKELEQNCSKLIEGADALLKTLKTREAALTRAEERIKLLDDAQLKTKAALAKPQNKINEVDSQSRCERMGRTVLEGVRKKAPEVVRKKAHTDYSLLKRELDKDDWLLGRH